MPFPVSLVTFSVRATTRGDRMIKSPRSAAAKSLSLIKILEQQILELEALRKQVAEAESAASSASIRISSRRGSLLEADIGAQHDGKHAGPR